MDRAVYDSEEKYPKVEELNVAVLDCWNSLGSDLLKRLMSSVQARCVQVDQQKVEKSGTRSHKTFFQFKN